MLLAAVAVDAVAMLPVAVVKPPVAADTAGVNPESGSPVVGSVAWYAFRP